MTYQLYIGTDCHQCQEVMDYIKTQDINCEFINIDQSDSKPPLKIFAFPALFSGNQLLAYGTDIIDQLKK